ncbi:MAG: SUMF1/EgtB/PvdO family nonheme iron enzyme [Desulfotignum sp.]|jgi:formylglycine-generating enzyme required for sulfatase activity|nr:SUMF1/EgtB/PvdO family nonheme iron enzyme [Desulfotignum sp.]
MGKMGLGRVVLVAVVILFTNGLGHALDSQQISDLKQAAGQGDTRAMRELAMVYYEGDGVLKDPVMAKCWIRQAYDLGDKQAKRLWNDLALWEYAGDCSGLLFFRQDMDTDSMGEVWQDPVTGMAFVWIPGGCFQMGCHKNAGKCRKDELPAHKKCLDGFWMGAHEVTQGQWQALMDFNPSRFQDADRNPVEMVSFEQVREFIRELNQKSPHKFSLPTEAQWEYACRNRGRRIPYAWGKEDFMPKANCGSCGSGDFQGRTAPVDSFYASDLGLYHMGGNVAEWCKNIYDKNGYREYGHDRHGSQENGRPRVVRGGAYSDNVSATGCTRRQVMMPAMKSERVGFRLVVKKRF